MAKLVYALLLAFSTIPAHAQTPLYNHFKWFKVEDGLPQSFISGLQQDKEGFIWIGTRDGLARYDGREFKIFRSQNEDSTSLSANVITDLYLDSQNFLWVFYVNRQFDRFNPVTLRVLNPGYLSEVKKLMDQFDIQRFFTDRQGKFWLKTNNKGVACYDPVYNKVTWFNKTNKRLSSDKVLGLLENIDGKICVYTENGIEIINNTGNFSSEFIPFPLSMNIKADVRNTISHFPDGTLILSENKRLVLYHPQEKKFETIPLPEAISKDQHTPIKMQVNDKGVLFIEARGGVYRLDKNNRFSYLWQYPVNNPGENYSISFFIDHSNVIWFGTNAAGICKIDQQAMPIFSSDYKKNFHADMLATVPGLAYSNLPPLLREGKWSYNFRYCYESNNQFFVTNSENEITETRSRVYRFYQNKLEPLPVTGSEMLALKGLSMHPDGVLMAVDKKGNIFKWKNLRRPPEKIPSQVLLQYPNTIVDLETDNKSSWISTDKQGLYRIDINNQVKHYSKGPDGNQLPTDQLTDICNDPGNDSILWVGTLGQGLVSWNKNGGVFKIYTTKDGLPNNTIYAIIPDDKGNLWLSTNSGISRFNLKTKTAYNIDVNDGLIGNEFNRFHGLKLPGGKIGFGGLEGYSVFDPATFTQDTFSTPVAISGLFVNNVPIDFRNNSNKFITLSNGHYKLDLPYNKNFLNFEFSGLQFNQPAKIHYRYMLKGFDDEWINAGTRNFASYTRLPPGKYTLLVSASNTSGNMSRSVTELSIVIRPPFWATWWAYTLYALIIILFAWTYVKYRDRQIYMQHEVLIEQNRANHLVEVDELKNRFFSNITHELRTPLTLIITPLAHLINESKNSPNHQNILSNIYRNANQLLRLINQLLDISRLNSGQMNIHLTIGEPGAYVNECVQQFYLPASEKAITIEQSNAIEGYYKFDVEKWEKILFNLMSNAIKFTPQNGNIKIDFQQVLKDNKPAFQLSVFNSGSYINEENLTKIFDRFFMVDDSFIRANGGTGIGLALVKELVVLMQGTVHVESFIESGTRFTIIIPAEHLSISENDVHPENSLTIGNNKFKTAEEKPNYLNDKVESTLILVVEDNIELRLFLVENLSKKRRVIEASNGETAWEKILMELPDIIISDVMMPGMDGFELCDKVKNDPRTAHISFLLLTAKSAHESHIKGRLAGANEFITKPFHLDELELSIHNLLSQQNHWRKYMQEKLLPENPTGDMPHVNDLFIQELYKQLEDQLDEPGLDVEKLAQVLNMSRRTLNRKLKSILNISANDMIRRYRLQKAAHFLSAGYTATDTAYKVGFETPSYFTHCFKEQYGQTPSEFANKKAV